MSATILVLHLLKFSHSSHAQFATATTSDNNTNSCCFIAYIHSFSENRFLLLMCASSCIYKGTHTYMRVCLWLGYKDNAYPMIVYAHASLKLIRESRCTFCNEFICLDTSSKRVCFIKISAENKRVCEKVKVQKYIWSWQNITN